MKRTMFRGLLVGFAITLLFGLGTNAVERGEVNSGLGQPGVATQQRTDGASRTGGWVDHKNREEMSLRTHEARGPRAFKLRAEGAINLATGVVMFRGVGTHVGLYRGNGFLDPAFNIFGSIRAANGDALDFTAGFSMGQMGEISATFIFSGGTGRFEDAVGQASGPVTLNPDFSFVIDRMNGFINY